MAKKKKIESESEEEVYHVEVITKARVKEAGKWEYYVKWGFYDESANSWEPEKNVKYCKRLLKNFWTDIGHDEHDYPIGYEVKASPEFIASEKEYFSREIAQTKDVEEDKKTKKSEDLKNYTPPPAKGKAKKVKKKSKRPTTIIVEDDSDDSDDTPIASSSKSRNATKRARAYSAESSSSSEPLSQPLRKVSKTTPSLSTSKATTKKDKGKKKESVSEASSPSLFTPESSPELIPPPAPPTTISRTSKAPPASISTSRPKRNELPKTVKPPDVSDWSKLTAKQRITQGALEPINPKKSSISAPRKSFPSFKKVPASASTSRKEEQKALEAPPEQRLPSPPPPVPFFTNDFVASPVDHPLDDFINDDQLFGSQSSIAASFDPPVDPLMDAADAFLQDIMPTSLAAPFQDAHGIDDDPVFRTVPLQPKPAPSFKIPKKYKWSGELFADIAQGEARKLCDVTLTDTTEQSPDGVLFSTLLQLADSIRFGRMHNSSDLEIVLRAFGRLQQVGKLGPQDEKDASSVTNLVSYMQKRDLIAFAPLYLDGIYHASMLVFPCNSPRLCERFKVPSDLRHASPSFFIAALFPSTLSSIAYEKLEWLDEADIPHDPTRKITLERRGRTQDDRRYRRGVNILDPSEEILEWMARPNRPCYIWWAPGDGPPKVPGIETKMLGVILRQCNASIIEQMNPARAVFVHAGALQKFNKFQGLAEKRSKLNSSFFIYGTSESVPRSLWGIHEIYAIGGIVTFTPAALQNNPWGTQELIKRISGHPLWECYLLPSVLGAVIKSSSVSDPISEFSRGELICDYLSHSIEDGQLSLLKSPPLTRCYRQEEDPRGKWCNNQVGLSGLSARNILEFAIDAFSNRRSTIAMEFEIKQDIINMQLQPHIMTNYRRYVIIATKPEIQARYNEGLEWLTVSEFDFLDDFYKTS